MSDEDGIARVARALCVAAGQAPEVGITVGTDVVDEGEAPRMIAAVRAMGLLE